MRHKVLLRWLTLATLLMTVFACSVAFSMRKAEGELERQGSLLKPSAVTPNTQNCSHRVGNVFFTITNWGFFGSQFNQSQLTELYCLGPGIADKSLAPSFEFPAGTGVNYLFQGALWIGAIVDEDTLVSVGADGWQWTHEMYPEAAPRGGIVQLSTRKTSAYYSPDAVSEQDFIAEWTDTLVSDALSTPDPMDNRSHKPLGIKVIQKSSSWSYSYAEDFILLDYRIVNVGSREISKAYIALYIDADCWHVITPDGFDDDITGYKHAVPNPACKELDDSINIAWIADNDGDPKEGTFNSTSTIAVSGTRVVRSPNPELQYSFNWWVSHGTASLDWGPRLVENGRDFGTGGLGTPEGDRNKYYIMSRREFDYDQIYSALDHSTGGWLLPPSIATDLADGFDTRYLFSFGPFDIGPNDTLPLTIGYIGGDRFHVRPDDFSSPKFDANNPQKFYEKLDFSDFATNAQWASWVYDNPGVDSDKDGNRGSPTPNPCKPGDTIWTGDGVPDFSGPPPPTPPTLRYSASPGKVTVRWNGEASETGRDPFSFQQDFEGYRVYMGDQLQLTQFALLTSYDREDFDRYKLNVFRTPQVWEKREIPFTLDSLKAIYEHGHAPNPVITDFDPLDYPKGFPLTWIEQGETSIDTSQYYFTQQDYNRSELDTVGGTKGTIVKVYPDATPADSVWVDDLRASIPKMYEYQFVIEGMLPSRPVFIAVTTFDFGNPSTSLAPLESSPLANAVDVFPVNSTDRVEQEKLSVTVFPNPYKINGGYQEAEYEDPNVATQYARRIYFANLPKKATIRIYTLDGDLVRELEHPQAPGTALYGGESMTAWDLISKNTQAVVSGIYLYSVESNTGNQVGKFVIIK